jgi:hypothetical protein
VPLGAAGARIRTVEECRGSGTTGGKSSLARLTARPGGANLIAFHKKRPRARRARPFSFGPNSEIRRAPRTRALGCCQWIDPRRPIPVVCSRNVDTGPKGMCGGSR